MKLEILNQIKFKPLLETLQLEDISDKEYFGPKYKDYVSNSRLSLINPLQGGCPKDFFEGLSKHNKMTDSLQFGSFLHMLVLQPESFFLCDEVDVPTGKAGMIAELLYNRAGVFPLDGQIIDAASKVGYYSGLLSGTRLINLRKQLEPYFKQRKKYEEENANLYMDKNHPEPIFTDPKTRERINQCLSSLKGNNEIQSLLKPIGVTGEELPHDYEKTILLDVEVNVPNHQPFVIKLKSKLDNYTLDIETNCVIVNDLKTTGRNIDFFSKAIESFHYKREIAMYSWLLGLCADKFFSVKNPTYKGSFLTVETIPPYRSQVFNFTGKDIREGYSEFIGLLRLVAYYTAFGYEC